MNTIKNILEFLVCVSCVLGLAFVVIYLIHYLLAYDETHKKVMLMDLSEIRPNNGKNHNE